MPRETYLALLLRSTSPMILRGPVILYCNKTNETKKMLIANGCLLRHALLCAFLNVLQLFVHIDFFIYYFPLIFGHTFLKQNQTNLYYY